MSRHAEDNDAPSQRGVIAALVAGALVIGGGAYALGRGTGSSDVGVDDETSAQGCSSAPLRVEAPPEIADLVKTQLASATKANGCHRYTVTGTRASSVASRIRQGKAPDVWISDSTVWLDQTTGGSAGSSVKTTWVSEGSLAQSPVVLANPVKSKDQFTGTLASWSTLINQKGQVHLANPHLDTASRLAFLASRGTSGKADVEAAQRIILLSRFAATSTGDLLASSVDPTRSSTSRSEPFPISEQALATYAKATPGVLAPLLPRAGTLSFDYPWTPAPNLSPALKEVADAGFQAMTSQDALTAFSAAGFRTDVDSAGPSIDGAEVGSITSLKQMAPAARLGALRQWDTLKADARMLAIIDVSGSMTTIAKDTGGQTRAEVAAAALTTAVKSLPAGTQAGGWVFSTDKGGKGIDYTPIAPVTRLDEPEGKGTHRDALLGELKDFSKYIEGDTGLYDTTAAAYAEMVKTYDPEYYNSVVIITDGKNDDPGGGLDLNQLLAQIKKTQDPSRPVIVVTIGMGEADTRALRTIAQATGGTSYSANSADDLLTVFAQALLSREPSQAQ